MKPRQTLIRLAVLGVFCLCLWCLLALGVPWLTRREQSQKFKQELAWIQNATRELEQAAAPPSDLIEAAAGGRWEADGYLIFSNGWVACRSECSDCAGAMNDVSVLKVPGGGFYLSASHLCTGIRAATAPVDGEKSQPLDVSDFLEKRGRKQGWYPFSPDGKRQCIVRAYVEHKKRGGKVRVLIAISDETPVITMFDRYFAMGLARVYWSANWAAEDTVNVELFDYHGRQPMLTNEDLPTRPLLNLQFRRDKQSGRFLEVTNAGSADL